MKNSEEIRMVREWYEFLYSEENMKALEALTASLKNALTVYTADDETPDGTPLYNTACPEYLQLMQQFIRDMTSPQCSLLPSDARILARLAEYGARRGNALCCYALGYCYEYGAGVAQSLHQALFCWQLSLRSYQVRLCIDKLARETPDALWNALASSGYLKGQEDMYTEEERQELVNSLAAASQKDLDAVRSYQFSLLYLGVISQLHIAMQPHTPNLTLLDPGASDRVEDYFTAPTEYIALLSQMLPAQRKGQNPLADSFDAYMQNLRSTMKYPFPGECRQHGRDELFAAGRSSGQRAVEHWNNAVGFYLSAALQGDAEGAAGVGYCCEHAPDEVEASRQLALQWYQHAAKAGSAWAMQRVGEYYDMGLCGPVDHETARQCFDLARKMGMPARV